MVAGLRPISNRRHYREFKFQPRTHPHAWNILLKDSEQQMPKDAAALCQKHGIDVSYANNVFWMVQLLEAWLLAHPEALEAYYALPSSSFARTEDVEQIPKSEALRRLKEPTRHTTKGQYDKVRHAPYLLERIDPDQVKKRARNCRKLFESVLEKLKESGPGT